MTNSNTPLKVAVIVELLALALLMIGCILIAWSRTFALFTYVALASLPICITGVIYSLKANRDRQGQTSRFAYVAIWGGVFLLVATMVIGFLGYAAGV
jgi:energy-converting hydrogenase Eha subunit E